MSEREGMQPWATKAEPEGPPYPYETRESPAFTAWVERRAVDLCTGAENGHDDAECRPCFAHLKAARWEGFGAWGLGP